MSADTAAARTTTPTPAQRMRMGRAVRFLGVIAGALVGYFVGKATYIWLDQTQGAALLGALVGLIGFAVVAGIGAALAQNVAGDENESRFAR